MSQISYLDDGGTVSLIFAPAIIPLITRLEKHFTSYELAQVSGLSTGYAVRLYELLIAWRSTGKTPVFELADFRQKMGVLESEYSRMHDFKKRVLDPSLEQVSAHTDITVKCEQHKTGRTITGFSFKFKQKQQPKIEKPIDHKRDPNTPDFFINMTDAQRHLFAHKLSTLHEMSEYSVGTESYEDFAKRIADMLLDPEKFRTFYPLLQKVGFRS